MAQDEYLRVNFVTGQPHHGLNTLVKILSRLFDTAEDDEEEDAERAKVQEWLTRLVVLLMSNLDGGAEFDDESDETR